MKAGILPLLFLVVVLDGEAREYGEFAVFSPQRKYVAEFRPNGGSPRIGLYRVEGRTASKAWEAGLASESWGNEPRILIDERGPVVIVQPQFPSQYGEVALTFLAEGEVLRAWKLNEVFGLLEDAPRKRSAAPTPASAPGTTEDPLRWLEEQNRAAGDDLERDRLWGRDGILPFFKTLHGQPLLCLWVGGKDRWLAWKSADGTAVSLPSEFAASLNRGTRSWARALIRSPAASDDRMKTVHEAGRGFAGLTNYTVLPADLPWRQEDREAAYKFLTKRHVAADKPLIQALLSAEGHVMGQGFESRPGPFQNRLHFTVRADDRNLGDYLLAVWERRWPKEWKIHGWGSSVGGDRDYFYLGQLNGFVQFPFPPETGCFWVYLIPAIWPPGRWKEIAPALYVEGDIGFAIEESRNRPRTALEPTDEPYRPRSEVGFTIEGIVPGAYRLKALWDRNTHMAVENKVTSLPKSWQYESVESPVFQVTAGDTVAGMELFCTNRALVDPRAYAEDEARIRRAQAQAAAGPDRRIAPLDRVAQNELQEAVLRYLIVRLLPRLPQKPRCFFVALGWPEKRKDPPQALFARFAQARIPLRPYSRAKPQGGAYVDSHTLERGLLVELGPLDQSDPDQIAVPVNVAASPDGAFMTTDTSVLNLTTYILIKRAGRWIVLGTRDGVP